ncbi:hypothetical protein HC248_01428 [Polaromonas vacuolata]|jgi:hypothetical protein|uniref:Uncharacterized protein n=1 Tax=Polaromonas vacuolata TaxID=37448 RepID=A0A6H2H8D2_9BURK|nr:hypothetical protein [Polaromonas vacuolata]QJC56142.1 hypothetical protein HC248_01428 [Polaromonas vacuolata]
MKIPLWGVISVAGAGIMCLITIWFNLQALTMAVQDLQITVKSGNGSVQALVSETALLKFRLGAVEADVDRLNDLARDKKPRAAK